jgi:hypothetical protein
MDFFKGFFGDEDKDKKASPAGGARPVLRVVGASHPPLNAPIGTSPQQQASQALPSPSLGSLFQPFAKAIESYFSCYS